MLVGLAGLSPPGALWVLHGACAAGAVLRGRPAGSAGRGAARAEARWAVKLLNLAGQMVRYSGIAVYKLAAWCFTVHSHVWVSLVDAPDAAHT